MNCIKIKKRMVLLLCLLLAMVSCIACSNKSQTPKEQAKNDQTHAQTPEPEPTPTPTPTVPEEPVVQKDTTLTFAGDTMLMTAALANYEKSGTNGILDPKFQELFRQSDISMLNEEFPFSLQGTPMPDKEYTFRIPPAYVNWYTGMGVDLVSLANNHALDYGKNALMDTFATLDAAGIRYVGAGVTKERATETQYVEANGKKFGFLSASRVIPVTAWNIEEGQPGLFCTYDPSLLIEQIKLAKQNCDYVVVYVHWGVEYQAYPAEYQKQMAHQFIDAGADLILGAHPHVLQGFEFYKDKPIVYSMGNFVFTKNIDRTMALKLVVKPDNQTTIQVYPGKAANAYTRMCTNGEAQQIWDYLSEISQNAVVDSKGFVQKK